MKRHEAPGSLTVPLDAPVWRWLAWGGIVLQTLSMDWMIWLNVWHGAVAIAVFIIVGLGFLTAQRRPPSFLLFLVALAGTLNAAGWALNWFGHLAWFDEFVHFFAPFAFWSALVFVARKPFGKIFNYRPLYSVALLAIAGLALGVLYELLEAAVVRLSWQDTFLDLTLEVFASLIAGWLAIWLVQQPARGHSNVVVLRES